VDKGIPAIQGFADSLGKTLGPAFGQIFTVIRDDVLPILTSWWEFLYKEIIPQILKIVGPILEGLKIAFDKIKKAVSDNSEELEPFYGFLEKIWDFTKKYLVPLLAGAFKTALEGLGTLVAGLVTAFGKFVGLLTSIYNGAKKVIDLIKDNPVTRLFGASNASFVGVSESQGLVFGGEDGSGGIISGGGGTFAPNAGSSTFTGAPLSAYSPAMQAAILRREELKAETERLRAQREENAATRITLNMGIVGDPEQAARTLIDVVNKSQARGTLGAGAFLIA
jgi:hypothetical protein